MIALLVIYAIGFLFCIFMGGVYNMGEFVLVAVVWPAYVVLSPIYGVWLLGRSFRKR